MHLLHEKEKKRAHEQRIREVEHSSFTPLVFSATGGMGREATCFYKLPGLHACSEVGSSILRHTLVAEVSSDLFPHPFSYPSLTRSKILSRSSRPPPSSLAITETHITPEFFNLFVSPMFPFLFCIYNITHFTLLSFVPLCHVQCMRTSRKKKNAKYAHVQAQMRT